MKSYQQREALKERRIDYETAISTTLGQKLGSEVEGIKVDTIKGFIKFLDTIDGVDQRKRSDLTCDIETRLSEEVDMNSDEKLACIYNVSNIPFFARMGIDGIVKIDFMERSQTDEPVVVTLKIFPQGYEDDYNEYRGKADLLIFAPNLNARNNDSLTNQYFSQVNEVVAKIIKKARDKNKKY